MTVKGNEEVYQRSSSAKRFTIFMGFSFSFFRIFLLCFLLLHDVSSTHLSKGTLPKILVLFDNQDQDSYPEEKVLCNFPCFKIETVLTNPSAFHWKNVHERDLRGFQWKFRTFVRQRKAPRTGEMLRKRRREDEE